jgi:hypothetical protein
LRLPSGGKRLIAGCQGKAEGKSPFVFVSKRGSPMTVGISES